MKLEPYPKYKDSGIDWIGAIPEGWKVEKIKYISENISDGDWVEFKDQVEFGDYKLIQLKNIGKGDIKNEIDKEVTLHFFRENNCREIKDQDLIIARIPQPILRTAVFSKKLGKCISVVDATIITQKKDVIKSKYICYFFNSDYGECIGDRLTNGATRLRISRKNIETVQIFFPRSLNEQQRIISFLDKKTSQLNKSIEKNQKLIELLKEKRTALINHAVTKGLDPNAKMKDSGVDWIGEIPEGWEVRKLKFSLLDKQNSIKTGPFGSQLKIDEMYDNEIKVYNQKNVIETDESIGENYISLDKFKELIAFKTVPGDLLITTRGTIGRTLRLSKNAEVGILHPCLMKINTNNNKVFDYYIEILIEETDLIKIQLQLLSCATTIEVIYQNNLKEVKFILPPLPEQQKIASFLDKHTSKIDKTIKLIENKIKLLEEYKKSLIHHVVTGKVDIREVKI